MSRRIHNKRDGLVTKVQAVRTLIDEDGFFIPYCNLQYHPGVCLNPDICEMRSCNHYQKLYTEKINYYQKK